MKMTIIKTRSSKSFFLMVILGLQIATFPLLAGEDADSSAYGKMVKEIRIEGLKRTKEYIVRRELLTKVGEPCLQENLEEEDARLTSLDIFSDIKIEALVEQDSVIVNYVFVETFPFLPSISIQITDENGISAGGGMKSPNLLGRDIWFSGRILVGGATTVEVVWEDPWITWNHLGYKLEYYHRERENSLFEFNEVANEFYAQIGSYLGEHGRIGGRWSFLSIKSDSSGRTINSSNRDYVNRVGVYLGLDTRDVWVDTRKGWWNEIELSREIHFLNSDTDFWQLDIDLRRYQEIIDNHILAFFSLMTLRTGEVGKEIAPWQQFGIGGTNTVRGWDFGQRIGKQQFINTLEYRYTILEPRLFILPFNINYNGGLQLAAFGDLGIAWDEAREFAANNFIGGFGLGIRFLLPIVGMLRIDFGWGQSGQGVFLHLGSFEKSVMARKRVR